MVTIVTKRQWEFVCTIDENGMNNPALIPRAFNNPDTAMAFEYRTKTIESSPGQYLAFPFAIKLGSSIVGIYSDGDAHAASDRQIMARTDDNGLTYETVVFYEDATGEYDFSLLTDLISPGQTEVFKVWAVTNTAGVFSATVVSPVSYGGNSYAMWSKVVSKGGTYYRTGYAVVGGLGRTAVFSSADKLTWTGLSTIAVDGVLSFNEADIVNTTGTTWVAIVREDTGGNNNLYQVTSTNDMSTWGSETLLDHFDVSGRQPNLIKMADNSIILCTGDRFGTSGYTGNGLQLNCTYTTGISVYRSVDACATWGFRTQVEKMYSTDGGQPYANITSDADVINIWYYTRRNIKSTPVIGSANINITNL